MNIEKRKLSTVDKKLIIELFNERLVKRHMPLASETFDESHYQAFLEAKKSIWQEYGFGPMAYFVNGEFIGWAGIQPDDGDFELALVLSPKFWGYGRYIYQELIKQAFDELNLESVTILFPPSRTRIKWILKAGFVEESKITIEGKAFIRYRLNSKRQND